MLSIVLWLYVQFLFKIYKRFSSSVIARSILYITQFTYIYISYYIDGQYFISQYIYIYM